MANSAHPGLPETVVPTAKESARVTHDELDMLRAVNATFQAKLVEHEEEWAKLLHQQAALQTVISSIPYCVFWKDSESVYLGCNDRFATIAGLDSPEKIIGKTDYDMPWKKEEADHYRECDRAVMREGKPILDLEETLLNADGHDTVILTSKVPLRNDEGNVIGMLGIFTDITARKMMERELNKAKEAAEGANRAKSDFLAAVSHELRTPLALVLGPLDTLRSKGELSSDVRQEIERVYRNAWRLKSQVDDILEFAKTDAGKTVPVMERVDVAELVRSLIEDAQPAAASRGLELSVETDPVGSTLLDRRMFEKILLNLVGNALKFTPRGGRIAVTLCAEDDSFELAVRDTGIGIDPRDQHLLFQRFQQVDASSTRRYEGSGLGLALVKDFAELMGGHVGLESEPGKGSRFFVVMPRRSGETTAPPCASARVGPSEPMTNAKIAALEARLGAPTCGEVTPSTTPRVDDARPCVVLAEDNADLRAYLVSLLTKTYRVLAYSNGATALAAALRHGPDVVVSDVMMPEMDGHELVTRMKADSALQHIPVILLTAQTGNDVVVSSLERGADDFLNKPFSPAELSARIAAAVRLRSAHKALIEKNREIVEVRDMLIEAEKFSALGRLLAQLSHEINNPMSVILGNLPALEDYLSALSRMVGEYRAIEGALGDAGHQLARLREELDIDFVLSDFSSGLRSIHEAAERVRDIQRDLRSFLRGDPVEKVDGNLNEALKVTVDMLKRGISADIAITTSYGELPLVRFNPGKLKQVFLNLLKNAVDSIGRRGEIRVDTRVEGCFVTVAISDSGPGVPEDIRRKIFEPFFSTKAVGKGSGLGLAVCRQIVEEHGGTIRLDESQTEGARFVIEVPAGESGKDR